VRHGPILSDLTSNVLETVIHALQHLAKDEKASFIRISPLLGSQYTSLFARFGFHPSPMHAMDAEYCWVLDLDSPVDVLLSNMRKSTRYDIKRATQMGVVVTYSEKERDLESFFRLYAKTSVRHGFVPHSGIRQEFTIFVREHKARLYIATYKRKRLAMAIILYYGNQAIYHHGASVPTKVPASALLQWTAIQDAKAKGLPLYNFWGIAQEGNAKHPWAGITGFKKGFGGRSMEYLHAQDKAISPLYILSYSIETVRRLYKGY
jgi:lipid II:glycine glycyltransferase (peptidoglycan interpeptide bridge formation enzyme)